MVSDLLPEAMQSECVRKKRGTTILSAKDYRDVLRSWVNDKSSLSYASADLSEEMSALKGRLSKHQRVIASQHAMLGSIEQFFSSDRLLPLAEKRASQLSNLLHEFDLELHIALSSQLDVAQTLARKGVSRSDAVEFLRSPRAWYDLIRRLAHACPDRSIVIWNLDDPIWGVPAFAGSLCDLGRDEIDDDLQDYLLNAAQREYALRRAFSWEHELPEETLVALREFYLDDLEKISGLENVMLLPAFQRFEAQRA